MSKWAYVTIYPWGPEMDSYQSSQPAVLATIPVRDTIAESLVERFLESRLESLLGSLNKSLLEDLVQIALIRRNRVFHGKLLANGNSDFLQAFVQSRVSVWKFWLAQGSKSVEALMVISMYQTYIAKSFGDYDHHHWHVHHGHHHHRHDHHQPWTKSANLHWKIVGSLPQILMENLSQRSALPKVHLSTFPAESQAAIVNPMTVGPCEIWLSWAH